MADPGDAKRRSMQRFEQLNTFVDVGIDEADLTPAAIVVWIVLFRHARPDGVSSVSIDTIHSSTHLCKRTVFRALKELTTKKLVKVVSKGSSDRKMTSRYAIRPRPKTKP